MEIKILESAEQIQFRAFALIVRHRGNFAIVLRHSLGLLEDRECDLMMNTLESSSVESDCVYQSVCEVMSLYMEKRDCVLGVAVGITVS